jgi:thiamine-monophosphate kinase
VPKKSRSTLESFSSEFERIAQISKILGGGKGAQVNIGIGDDAAVIRIGAQQAVWTTDSAVEGVHFRLDLMSLEDVGWRSFNAAVSDIAAMGAKPLGALSALELPKTLSDKALGELVEGQALAAQRLGCPLIGGNLAQANGISITTTVLGQTRSPLLRRNAKEGDEIWLVGDVGLSNAGLRCLLLGKRRPKGSDVEHCIESFRRPMARLVEGKRLVGRAHALIDVSDGLAGDASHIAKSSRVAIVFNEEKLLALAPKSLNKVASRLRISPLDCMLYGGEDYALLATGPRTRRPTFAVVIGHVESGKGVWLDEVKGRRSTLRGAFDHFEKRS